MSAPVLLELRDVRRDYAVRQGLFRPARTLHALNGVSLQLRKGDVLGIVGESGCGKSTLAKILLGLETPSAGEVLFDGRPLAAISRAELTRRIQLVFQDPYSSLNPRKSVASLISLPLRAHGVGSSRDHRREVARMLDLVGLPARVIDNTPNQLSGGQRQRVAIARALIMKPEIVICDEPTSALDVSVQSQILNLLEDLRGELGLTYLFVSHNLAVVEHLATRVAVMYLGRVVEQADVETLFAQCRHPYTRALLDSVLTAETGLGVPETKIGASFPNPLDIPVGCSFHPRCAQRLPACSVRRPSLVRDGAGDVECLLWDRDGHVAPPTATKSASGAQESPPS